MSGKNESYFEVTESNLKENVPSNAYMVKPCEWYKDDYKDCKRIRARFHQYFIYGETLDCSQWKRDYDSCIKFRKTADVDSLRKVIESEQNRQDARTEKVKANDVWEYRTTPPENWNAELPEWMQEMKKNSYLDHMQQRTLSQNADSSKSSQCTIL